MMINLVHRVVYFVPEAAEEYGALGVHGAGGYFGSRSAPMGAVPDEVIIATFYNFSPLAITVGDARRVGRRVARGAASRPLPSGRPIVAADGRRSFRRADRRGGSLIDPVVAGLDPGGKPLAAANAAVALPDDPLVALWQQLTVVREWRGDVHIAMLVTNELGPCDCLVLQVSTGRFPLRLAQATRRWNESQWAAAIARLGERGWMAADGSVTPAGRGGRGTASRPRPTDCANRSGSRSVTPARPGCAS